MLMAPALAPVFLSDLSLHGLLLSSLAARLALLRIILYHSCLAGACPRRVGEQPIPVPQ